MRLGLVPRLGLVGIIFRASFTGAWCLACLLSGGVLPVPFTCASGERRAGSTSRVARSLWTVAWERSVNRSHTPDSPRSTPAGGVAVRRQLPTTRGRGWSWSPGLRPSCGLPTTALLPSALLVACTLCLCWALLRR